MFIASLCRSRMALITAWSKSMSVSASCKSENILSQLGWIISKDLLKSNVQSKFHFVYFAQYALQKFYFFYLLLTETASKFK